MEVKMKIPREDTAKTRKSLLDAACEIFAQKGYRDTTIAEICAQAEERFRAHVKATIGRLADKNNREFWFVQREFNNPTGLLEEVMRKEINPLQKKTECL